MSTKLVSFLNFQVLCPLVYTEDHPLNISSGLFCQAAAKGVLWKSCKLMFTQNTRPKRCKMSPGQKMLKSQLREQLSNRCLVVAASIELKLYRVWYTGLYPPAFMGWLIQYAAKQGRISSVIEKYELKGRPWSIVPVTAQCNQLYPLSYLLSYHYLLAQRSSYCEQNLLRQMCYTNSFLTQLLMIVNTDISRHSKRQGWSTRDSTEQNFFSRPK